MPKEPQSADPEWTTVTVAPDIRKALKRIADHHGIRVGEALERYGGPGIRSEHKRVVEVEHAELGGEG